MVRDYELMYIVRPDVDDDGLATVMAGIEGIVQAQGGEVVSTTPWGKRRLAYEIEHLRDGHYVILHVRLEASKVADVERLLHISDHVFRHLVTIWVPRDETATEEDAAAADGAPRAERVPVAVAAGGGEIDDEAVDIDDELDDVVAGALEDE
jgi:small subunit ribosomal protein S6